MALISPNVIVDGSASKVNLSLKVTESVGLVLLSVMTLWSMTQAPLNEGGIELRKRRDAFPVPRG